MARTVVESSPPLSKTTADFSIETSGFMSARAVIVAETTPDSRHIWTAVSGPASGGDMRKLTIVVNCTDRKSIRPVPALRIRSLPPGDDLTRFGHWRRRVEDAEC